MVKREARWEILWSKKTLGRCMGNMHNIPTFMEKNDANLNRDIPTLEFIDHIFFI